MYNEYMRGVSAVSSLFTGIGHSFVEWLLGFKFVRYLAGRALKSGTSGPTEKGPPVVMEDVAIADVENSTSLEPRGHATLRYPNGPYDLTGLILAQGAASILHSAQGREKNGCLTTALIAADLIRRLKGAGVAIESDILHA
ncbi:hypothetical protein F5X98DRAFT_352373 [Xylaria grammica]|nr:hypothetical protein F5X98DRAFT_352373 [Xylaria grammica]